MLFQGATLQSRLALSSIFQCVDKVFTDVVFPRIVSAFQRSQIKIQQATTPAHLEGIIETLDGMWEGRRYNARLLAGVFLSMNVGLVLTP
jgi:hypothetical protein